jgi:hypothetical protein
MSYRASRGTTRPRWLRKLASVGRLALPLVTYACCDDSTAPNLPPTVEVTVSQVEGNQYRVQAHADDPDGSLLSLHLVVSQEFPVSRLVLHDSSQTSTIDTTLAFVAGTHLAVATATDDESSSAADSARWTVDYPNTPGSIENLTLDIAATPDPTSVEDLILDYDGIRFYWVTFGQDTIVLLEDPADLVSWDYAFPDQDGDPVQIERGIVDYLGNATLDSLEFTVPDGVAPVISNITAEPGEPGNVVIRLPIPGDDGALEGGTVLGVLLKASHTPITSQQEFDEAITLAEIASPGTPGGAIVGLVLASQFGFSAGDTMYVAAQAWDEQMNYSDIVTAFAVVPS